MEDCGHKVRLKSGRNAGTSRRRPKKGCDCDRCEDLRESVRRYWEKNREKNLEKKRRYMAQQDQVLYAFLREFTCKKTDEVLTLLVIGKSSAVRARVGVYNSKSFRQRLTWNLVSPDLDVSELFTVVCNDFTPAQLAAAECKFKSEVLLMGDPLPGHTEMFPGVDPYSAVQAAHTAVRWTRESIARNEREKKAKEGQLDL